MSSEYIRISKEQSVYGQKNLLQAELETLTCVKRMRAFKDLRKEEIILKIALKNKIEEVKEILNILEKILPKTHDDKKVHTNEKIDSIYSQESKQKISLETELEEIRRKLERFH